MVYITGDMHGDIKRFDSPAIKKLKKGDTLIVCGDFGFVWDNSKAEQKILKSFSKRKYNETNDKALCNEGLYLCTKIARQ